MISRPAPNQRPRKKQLPDCPENNLNQWLITQTHTSMKIKPLSEKYLQECERTGYAADPTGYDVVIKDISDKFKRLVSHIRKLQNTEDGPKRIVLSLPFKPGRKHLSIFKTIKKNGYYKPSSSDQEPATVTLIKNGLVDWRSDFKGVEFTEKGRLFVKAITNGN